MDDPKYSKGEVRVEIERVSEIRVSWYDWLLPKIDREATLLAELGF